MNAKTHNANRAAAILRDRRRANAKRTISTYVGKVAQDTKVAEGVTNALRTVARKLRLSGALGRVQTITGRVDGVVRRYYRYTAAQVAVIAATYKPRKAEFKAVRTALAV